jgi:hypothetical protein
LQNNNRPYAEQVFFNIKQKWAIISQTASATAYDKLMLSEWTQFMHDIVTENKRANQ